MPGRESIATIYSNTLYLCYCNFHLNLPWGTQINLLAQEYNKFYN